MIRQVLLVCGKLACAGLISTACLAQEASPLPAMLVAQTGTVLPLNTPIYLTLNETLNTKSSRTKKGSTFPLTVARDVLLGRYVVIPRGSRATGTVIYRTRKGGFGKSGKLEISLDYVEVGSRRIAIEGRHREEGEGNSTATVATFVLLSMIGSGLITGRSAEIPAGHEFTAWTKEEVSVQLIGADGLEPEVTNGVLAARPRPEVPALVKPAVEDAKPRFGNGRVRCSTCQ